MLWLAPPPSSNPGVTIKLDISNAFNALCRQLALDVLAGKASFDNACGLKEDDNIETVCRELRNMFEYFRAIRTTKSSPTCGTWTIAATSSTPGVRPVDSKEIPSR